MPLHIHVDLPFVVYSGCAPSCGRGAVDTIPRATAFGRCVGNATRAATLDSMREVPTWPRAPPAPWPPDTTLASGGNAVGSFRGLLRADRNLHDEARAEFAARRRYDNASGTRGGRRRLSAGAILN